MLVLVPKYYSACEKYGSIPFFFAVDIAIHEIEIWLVWDQHVHFFYARSHFRKPKTGTQISQPIFELFEKLNSPVHNLLF